jgi:hypothetical protein
MTEFKNWLMLKATPRLMASFAMLLALILHAEATVVKDLRIGDNKSYLRMVLELDRPLTRPPSVSIDRNTVEISLTGVLNNLSAPRTGEYRDGIASLDVSNVSDAIRVSVVFSFAPADVKTFSLTAPHRFIIDAYRPPPSATPLPPIEHVRQISPLEDNGSGQEPYSEPVEADAFGGSGSVSEASIKPHGTVSVAPVHVAEINRNRFQQQLIAALIGVTSIIVVLLFFLIWMGSGRNPRRETSWINHLPQTKDPTIENIDTVIRNHLKCHGHQ